MKRIGILDIGVASAIVLARNAPAYEERELHRCAQAFADSDDVERAEDGSPTAFRMWRAGLNRTDHGDHYLTPAAVKLLLETQRERGNRFSFDVDHLSLSETAPPEARKAVGWFNVEERDGDLWAVNVEWTDVVRAGFGKDVPEWRYFSPAYETKKKSGEIVRLINCALTNNPATHHVTALASSAQQKETAMNEYEKMTLAALLAAMDEEKDEGKKKEMETVARAKIKAAFPDPDGDGDKDKKASTKAGEEPPKKEEPKKETKAGEEPPKKEEASAGADVEAKAAAMVTSLTDRVLANVTAKQKAIEEKAEIDRILAAMPSGDRELCKDMTLEQVKRVAKRLNPEALTSFAAASQVAPTVGGPTIRAGMLPRDEREKLDHAMGMQEHTPFVREEGSLLIFGHNPTKEEADQVLASIAKERTTSGVKKDSEALALVLAKQTMTNTKGATQ